MLRDLLFPYRFVFILFAVCIANVFPVDYECFHLVYGGCDVEEGKGEVIDMP